MKQVCAKLNQARERLHKTAIKKSGRNAFAGYNYHELSDFLLPTLAIFKDLNLCGVVSYTADMAKLTITDIDSGEALEITSPMGKDQLKGCHEVQNIGAVETYQRRYLWVTAMEIVEHDALDSSEPLKDEETQPVKGKANPEPELTGVRKKQLAKTAQEIIDCVAKNDDWGAFGLYETEIKNNEEKNYIWPMIPSDCRSAIKRCGEAKAELEARGQRLNHDERKAA